MTPPGRRRHAGFSLSVTEDDQRVVVRFGGVLDEESSSLIALWLTPTLLLSPDRPVVLDLTELTTLHRSGLDLLADLAELAGHRGCDLGFVMGACDGRNRPLRLEGIPEPQVAELVRVLSGSTATHQAPRS
jgi:ABC-type transporter Mla MlaB component